MRHQIIVLGRQFGSGGRQVGRKLAAALNVPCYDREIITMAAERAELGADFFEGKDEKRTNPWLYESVYRGGPRVKWGQSAEEILAQKNLDKRQYELAQARLKRALVRTSIHPDK